MAKPDFPALLAPGMHNLTLADIQALAVDPFPDDVQRTGLYQNLMNWVGALNACGVNGTLWMDGSFLTVKPSPSDIDCVLWYPQWSSVANDTASPLQNPASSYVKRVSRLQRMTKTPGFAICKGCFLGGRL